MGEKTFIGTVKYVAKTGGLKFEEAETWYNPVGQELKDKILAAKETMVGQRYELTLGEKDTSFISMELQGGIVNGPTIEKTITTDKVIQENSGDESVKNIQLHGKNYTTHAGLLDAAHKGEKLLGIETTMLSKAEDDVQLFKACVIIRDGEAKLDKDGISFQQAVKRFVAYGDANKDNVSENIKPHIIRMAETRAINRALRLATNKGDTSEEELGEKK